MTPALDDPLVGPAEAYPSPGAAHLGVAARLPDIAKLTTAQPGDVGGEPSPIHAQMLGDLTLDLRASWLVKGLVPRGAVGALFGPSGSGKSFVAIDLAAHVAAGVAWLGRRTRQAGAVYIALEGGGDAKNRLLALRQDRPDLANGALAFIDTSLDLTDEHDLAALAATLDHLADGPMRQTGPGLIVIDTLACAASRLDENSAADMTDLMNTAKDLAKPFGASLLFVHHTGWENTGRPRGSSALKAASDVMLAVEGDAEARALSVYKLKAGPEDGRWGFSLKSVSLGHDEDGDVIGSCVVAWSEATAKTKKLTPAQALVLRALTKAISDDGHTRRGHAGDMVRAVSRDRWTEEAMRMGASKSDKAADQKRSVRRCQEKLQAIGCACLYDDHAWLPDNRTGADR